MREAMAELKGRVIGGEGKVAEIGAGYFGAANLRADLIVIRERDGNTLPAVFKSDGTALSFIIQGTIVNADGSGRGTSFVLGTR